MINLEDEDERTALEFAIEPLEAMMADERVEPGEQVACGRVVDVIKELLEGQR